MRPGYIFLNIVSLILVLAAIDTTVTRDNLKTEVRAAILNEAEREGYVIEAARQFPQLLDHKSDLRRACLERYGALAERNDPILDRPDYPLVIASQEAARLGLTPRVEF